MTTTAGTVRQVLWAAASAGLALCLASAEARADGLRLGAELGGGVLAGDAMADLTPQLEVAAPHWSLGLGAPLRLRLYDAAPADRCATPGLRCADWNRAADWARLLRHLDLGHWQGAAHLHVGDLNGLTLGHGSLVWRHYNNQLLDTWRLGAAGHLTWRNPANRQTSGLSLLAGDVLRGDVLAARAWGRPFGGGRWQPLEFGVQVALDRRIYQFERQGAVLRGGGPDLEGSTGWRTVDAVGLDAGYEVVRSASTVVSLWSDAVLQPGRGLGVHGGLRGSWRGERWTIGLTAEGRLGSRRYVPALFGPLYELERVWVAQQGSSPVVGGSRGALELAHAGWGKLVLAVDHVAGQRLDTYAWLMTDELARLSLRAFAGKRWVRRGTQVNGTSWGTDPLDWLAHVTARLRLDGPWYASLSGGRRWLLRDTWAVGSSPLYGETELRLAAGGEWRW